MNDSQTKIKSTSTSCKEKKCFPLCFLTYFKRDKHPDFSINPTLAIFTYWP